MREINIKNDKILKILEKKGGLIDKGRELTKQIEGLEKERNKVGLQVQKLKDKTAHLMDKEDIKTEEFEYVASVDLKDGEVVLTIKDAIEEYKQAYRERISQKPE